MVFTTVMVDFVCKLTAVMFAIIMALYAVIYYKVSAENNAQSMPEMSRRIQKMAFYACLRHFLLRKFGG